MKVKFLGAYGGNTNTSNLTSFLVDDCFALDAGCLTQVLTLEQQVSITDVVVTHSHLDHTLCLPFLVDNLFDKTEAPLRIWAGAKVIDALRKHIFNDVVWPDFTLLPSPEKPMIEFRLVEPEKPFQIGHLRIMAVPVNHVVPCFGYFVENDRASVLFTSDTCNTDRIWEIANRKDNLKAVVVDCSFPNHMEELARNSGHLTPNLLANDLAKLEKDCRILIYHLKPMFQQTVLQQLEALNRPGLETRIQGHTFEF